MYHRLKHHKPNMNDKNRWWVAIGETPLFYLTVMYGKSSAGKASCLNSTVHAALKADYAIVEESLVAQGMEGADDVSELL